MHVVVFDPGDLAVAEMVVVVIVAAGALQAPLVLKGRALPVLSANI